MASIEQEVPTQYFREVGLHAVDNLTGHIRFYWFALVI